LSSTETSEDWYTLSINDVFKKLETSEEGISPGEVEQRLKKYGFNELVAGKRRGPLDILIDQFKDIFVIMLLFACAVSIFVAYYRSEPYTDAITILVIVGLVAVVGFIQEYRSERALEAMKEMTAPRARVIRLGEEVTIPSREVVPGDLIVLDSGDRIPADARLIETIDMSTNEAPLTGESTPVSKMTNALESGLGVGDRKNMVFMGTHTTFGRGKAIITNTGMTTEFGKIAELVQSAEEEATPLERKLDDFAKRLALLTALICGLIFVLEGMEAGWQLDAMIDAFLSSIALAVSVVPEGLPAVTTVTLALGARDLARQNAVIRKLSSAETLGAVTIICSDKTGTLTKGEMTVKKLYTNKKIVEVSGVGYEPVGKITANGKELNPAEEPEVELLLRIGSLCSNARLVQEEESKWNVRGDPTEGALVVAAEKIGIGQDSIEKEYPRLHEIPFSSERKRMTTCHIEPDGNKVAYLKGAPEVVLERSVNILQDGEEVPLTDEMRKTVLAANEQLASEALRVLGMAYKKLPESAGEFDSEMIENELTFVGLQGMIDPPRDEAIAANSVCEEAGIQTVMITGDHKLTAVAVAEDLGMMEEDSLVLTGAELDNMSDEEFNDIVEKVVVYARVSPEHKMRIVTALKSKGHIVAMTGDGVNDAPAVKNSDIGVAMGITGTDVTKEASHMVLADDNFATIVTAVKGGRTIYDNIRKYARFLLACNFDEVLVIGTFALLNFPLPMTAAMILWINLVTDGGPAMALSMERAAGDIMKRRPRDPKEGILSGMLSFIIVSFLLQAGGSMIVFLGELWPHIPANYQLGMDVTQLLIETHGYEHAMHIISEAQTAVFVQASLFELFVVWNCRSDAKGIFRGGISGNKWLVLADVVSFVATSGLGYVPIFAAAFDMVPLTLYDWVWVAGVASWGLFCSPEIFYGRKILKWK